ncbi:universal stress protein [Rhodoferax sp.]|uniref:universal stress protein n=1 Tax=Rhodoferax sp. TaxID=50421 RepID=UPI0027209498|nr:universal stress protein [Rhodoferax sp.]MDO9195923.1 universal stress protein [Rhodoferax sp.]
MTAIPEECTTPHHLLLATDLSARCDRALDRAAQLVNEWHTDLVALHVLGPAASPDQTLAWASGASDEQLLLVARQQLAHDLATTKVPATLRLVRSEDAAAAIRETAASTQSGLVVTGVSCNEALGRFLLGSTVENLARSLSQPLLVVRKRTRGSYQRIVVASDFSESSRLALLAAARLFPGRELILYHAHALAMSGLANASPHPGVRVAIEETECAAFLAETTLPEGMKVRPVIECGAIEGTLTRYVREHDIDLVVMGSHGRSGLMSLLLGSTAAKLLDWLPCDTLLVREPTATT